MAARSSKNMSTACQRGGSVRPAAAEVGDHGYVPLPVPSNSVHATRYPDTRPRTPARPECAETANTPELDPQAGELGRALGVWVKTGFRD